MRRARLLTLATIGALAAVVTAQSGTADGVSALARGDFQRAAEILRPIAEQRDAPDPVAQFFMATLYESGRGVPPDPMRACVLFQEAMRGGGPFAEQAGLLRRRLLLSRDNEWTERCSQLGVAGLNHPFDPTTFTLGPGHTVEWDLAVATVTYQGRANRVPVLYASRHAIVLPLRYTRLATTGRRPESRDYLELFAWEPYGERWNLQWFLFEVVQADLTLLHSETAVTSVSTPEPSAVASSEALRLIDLHVNENGAAEYSILGGAHPRTQLIGSEVERREDRDRERARSAADARVDWTLVRDPHRQPSLAYVDADGCGNFLLYGWSEDRTEVVTFRADEGALRLPRRTPGTFEIGDRGRSFSLNIHVYDRPLRPAFCSDAKVPSPPGELWRAVAGTVTIELSPRNIRAEAPHLYWATVRIANARFVNDSGGNIRQTQPIMLTAMVGRTNVR